MIKKNNIVLTSDEKIGIVESALVDIRDVNNKLIATLESDETETFLRKIGGTYFLVPHKIQVKINNQIHQYNEWNLSLVERGNVVLNGNTIYQIPTQNFTVLLSLLQC
jgi:hypothetical protein